MKKSKSVSRILYCKVKSRISMSSPHNLSLQEKTPPTKISWDGFVESKEIYDKYYNVEVYKNGRLWIYKRKVKLSIFEKNFESRKVLLYYSFPMLKSRHGNHSISWWACWFFRRDILSCFFTDDELVERSLIFSFPRKVFQIMADL